MPQRHKTILANIFGTLGYFFSLLLWMWVAILYLPLILDNEQVKMILLQPSGEQALSPSAPAIPPSPFMMILALGITAAVIAVTVFLLLRVPVTIARTGRVMTTKAAGSIEPLIVRGKPLPARKRKRLTASLIKLIKLLIVIVPVVAALGTALFPAALPFAIVIFVTGFLAAVSVFWFGAQYACAALLRVTPEQLV